MYVHYYVFNNRTGYFMLDHTGCHGLYIWPSECQWMVPGTVDPNEDPISNTRATAKKVAHSFGEKLMGR